MRLGFIARADNGGLGCESWEFAKHMKPDRLLVIRGEHGHHPERFAGTNAIYTDGIPNSNEVDQFLRDIDIVFSIETFYNWGIIPMARQRGIKSVLRLNYEFNINQVDPNIPVPDFFIAPSVWYYDQIPFPNKKFLPFPVNRTVCHFKRRSKIREFYHVAGHSTYEDRNGTQSLIAALPYLQTKPKIRVYAQHPLEFPLNTYSFLEVVNTDTNNYWEVHDGDCNILPRRYGGQSLQLNEALSCGIPTIMPSISPQDSFLHPDMLFPIDGVRQIPVQGGIIDCAVISPQKLAQKIDALYTEDVGYLSDWANDYAKTISWTTLKPKFEELFNEIQNTV